MIIINPLIWKVLQLLFDVVLIMEQELLRGSSDLNNDSTIFTTSF